MRHHDPLQAYNTILIYSPHYDDAFLSLGGYLGHVSNLRSDKQLKVIVVFGRSSNIPALKTDPRGNDLDQQVIDSASKIRREEERANTTAIGADLLVWDIPEALLRGHRRRENTPDAYPVALSKDLDGECVEAVGLRLQSIVEKHSSALHLLPLGIGDHVDHVLVRQVSEPVLCRVRLGTGTVGYFEDMPYVCDASAEGKIPPGFRPIDLPADVERKLHFLASYRSQKLAKRIPRVLEYMNRTGKGEYKERVWMRK